MTESKDELPGSNLQTYNSIIQRFGVSTRRQDDDEFYRLGLEVLGSSQPFPYREQLIAETSKADAKDEPHAVEYMFRKLSEVRSTETTSMTWL
jgi:hypothetical protein